MANKGKKLGARSEANMQKSELGISTHLPKMSNKFGSKLPSSSYKKGAIIKFKSLDDYKANLTPCKSTTLLERTFFIYPHREKSIWCYLFKKKKKNLTHVLGVNEAHWCMVLTSAGKWWHYHLEWRNCEAGVIRTFCSTYSTPHSDLEDIKSLVWCSLTMHRTEYSFLGKYTSSSVVYSRNNVIITT